MLQKAFWSQPALEMDKNQRIEYCSGYAQPLMWGSEYIKPCANKYITHLTKLVQSLVCVKLFGFVLLYLSCKTPFSVQSRCGGLICEQPWPKALKCCSMLPQLPGVAGSAASSATQLEVRRCRRNRCTSLQCICQGRTPSLFLPGPVVGCTKPCSHGQEKLFLGMCNLSGHLCPESYGAHKSAGFLSTSWRLLCTKAGSFRHGCACSEATDLCHVNVSAGVSVP